MATKTLRLILGDQLNVQHSWFNQVQEEVSYILMEIKAESEYVRHHIQKITGIFGAMRQFADLLRAQGHQVYYYKISDTNNQHSFEQNLNELIQTLGIQRFEYQEPDEYRLDNLLKNYVQQLSISSQVYSTEHFYTCRQELAAFFEKRKAIVMEYFYRHMRKKHQILIDASGGPEQGKWNFDQANRKKLPKKHLPPTPFVFHHNVEGILEEIEVAGLESIGTINGKRFIWPLNRNEALEVLNDFIFRMLPFFGLYQDAMHQEFWSIYHSRLSFAMNIKLIGPREIIEAVEQAYYEGHCDIAQAEGFIRQILGWREFMRGIYWKEMPSYAQKNALNAQQQLPSYFWTGKTKMNCMQKSIQQSLDYAYAHHIQRLMVTGNFCLIAGIHPDEVDAWYLGIYIDAFEWVEITNTRGMSQFADGGIVATKPYCSSGNYIDKMSNYCTGCYYNKKEKVGEKSCPFNALYWNFLAQHKENLSQNHRMSMIYRVWNKFSAKDQQDILQHAAYLIDNLESL